MTNRILSRLRRYVIDHVDDDQRAQLAELRHALIWPVMTVRSKVRSGDLEALAQLHRLDKSSRGHGYTELYRRHLAQHRRRATCVLEIGVGGNSSTAGYEERAGGQSLRMWRRYFPNATIVGIDIHPKDIAGDRLAFECGSQDDADFLHGVASRHGPFDVIIDDGSHIGRHIHASMTALWPAVKPGGFYVIEDLQTSYHEAWEGGPPGTPGTGAALLRDQVDSTLRREGYRPPISELHIYAQIAFLRKPR